MPEQSLKPAEGRRVRHPDGRLLAEEGEAVTLNAYWHRKIEDDDVETVGRASRAPRKPRGETPAGDKA